MDICGWSGGAVGGGAKRFCQTEHGRGLRYQNYVAGRAFSAIGVFSPRAKRQLKKGDVGPETTSTNFSRFARASTVMITKTSLSWMPEKKTLN